MPNLFRNLFIPQKTLPQFTPQAYRTDMQAIENWANTINNISFSAFIGANPPMNIQSTLSIDLFVGTASGGILTVPLTVPYKFGYTAVGWSADSTLADTAAMSLTSTLANLEVYVGLAGSPVSGPAGVIYLICGA